MGCHSWAVHVVHVVATSLNQLRARPNILLTMGNDKMKTDLQLNEYHREKTRQQAKLAIAPGHHDAALSLAIHLFASAQGIALPRQQSE